MIWYVEIKIDITSERLELEPQIEYHIKSFTETHLSGKLQSDRSRLDFFSRFRTLVGEIYTVFVARFFISNSPAISKQLEIETPIEAQSTSRFKALLYSSQQIL